jgi:acyl-CoA synthetase (AMP-forming)/AMP-acid ligase II
VSVAATTPVNVARHLAEQAGLRPSAPALRIPVGTAAGGAVRYVELSFADLAAEAQAWAWELARRGVQPGDRTLVLVRPGLPLIAAVFALFQMGAPPVVIDPGMGRRAFLECVRRSQPRALLGIPSAWMASWIFRDAFRSVRRRLWVSPRPAARRARGPVPTFPCAPTAADDLAAILFTSGSTGAPKGVCYEHGMFAAQVRLVRTTYGIEPGEVDLPMLPIFALFNPALGVTTVVPEVDPSRPATLDPARAVRAIQQNQVTTSFGSPVVWRTITRHCLARGIELPSVRRLLMAGAPVPPALFADCRRVFPSAALHSPYGATEALPVSTIEAREVLETTAALTASGRGTCVGRLLAEMEARIIALHSGPIARLAEAPPLPDGAIGEIVVRGPVVTVAYDLMPEATAAAKILGDDGAVWHRMGDAGYIDPEGRLWFCGRVVERVETTGGTLFTDLVEPIYNRHPRVHRTALIGFGPRGRQVPALAVEPWPDQRPGNSADKRAFARELRDLGRDHPALHVIRLFFFVDAFPVDVRHNAKIHRLRLARDLAGQPGIELDKR